MKRKSHPWCVQIISLFLLKTLMYPMDHFVNFQKEAKNENIMLNRYLQTQQQPAPQAYFSPPTPSYSYTPSYSDYSEPCYSSYSNCSRPSYSYSPSVASGSSSSSTRTRVNYTQAENTKLANLYAKHGNDHARVTREFNSSSACQNVSPIFPN